MRWIGGTACVYGLVDTGFASVRVTYGVLGVRAPSMHSDPIRSRTIGEFWGRRWNRVIGGWLAGKWPLGRLLAAAMVILSLGLFALPRIASRLELFGQAILMGLAGGLVTVLFFTVWGRYYGRVSVGRIQGAAQTVTVLGSAVGPLLLAKVVASTGSYSPAFVVLGSVVLGTGVAAWFCPVPAFPASLRSAQNIGASPSR